MAKDYPHFDEFFTNIANASHNWFNNLLSHGHKAKADNPANVFVNMYQNFFKNTTSYLMSQQKFYQEQMAIWEKFFKLEAGHVKQEIAKPADKRFTDPDWETNPFFAYLKESYLKMSNYLVDCVSQADMDEETRLRMRFFMNQYLDAISPSNFALTNPEVIKAVVDSGGMSLVEGMQNMSQDMSRGYIAMTDESMYQVGENLAVTPGEVIFKNDLIELIQYKPQTESVYKTPLLIVPPCINKYYILDLQQENSFVKYLVEQGYTVFLISWKSADLSMRDFKWEEYVNLGVIKSLEVIRSISRQEKINTLGYCIGGIILTTACLVMQAHGLDWVNSMSHMTVMLDHAEPGDIKFFIDRDLIELEEEKKRGGGIMSGRIISQTFSALRANELIWSYWVNNYLLGKKPKPFDILFWNNDAVDLPLIMHSFLLKCLYSRNDLVNGKLVIDGVKMDLTKLNHPAYLFAAHKDHIVPWTSAYKTIKYLKGDVRFVLGASGHTAGVVNSVSANKRNYWVNNKVSESAEEWFATATEMPGSWWVDFATWLQHLSGTKVKARKTCGNVAHQPIIAAPGEYVMAKAMPISVAVAS